MWLRNCRSNEKNYGVYQKWQLDTRTGQAIEVANTYVPLNKRQFLTLLTEVNASVVFPERSAGSSEIQLPANRLLENILGKCQYVAIISSLNHMVSPRLNTRHGNLKLNVFFVLTESMRFIQFCSDLTQYAVLNSLRICNRLR